MNEDGVLDQQALERQERARLAGEILALRRWKNAWKPKDPIRVTGRVFGKRRRVGQLLVLPDGKIGELRAARRGKVVAVWEDLRALDPLQLGLFNEDEVQIHRVPAAVLLGRLKAGRQERRSLRKAQSCRRNGMMPCAPGKRRGRPRKDAVDVRDSRYQVH